MTQRLYFRHWLDWTIAIIFMIFIGIWGQVQLYIIELETTLAERQTFDTEQYNDIKSHRKLGIPAE